MIGVGVRDTASTDPLIAREISHHCLMVVGSANFRDLAEQSDVVITWGIPDLSMLAGTKAKVVVVAHGHCPWTVNCLREACKVATYHAAVSRHATMSFANPNQVTVIHNGIDVDRCVHTIQREQQRKIWNVQANQILIGYVGRFSEEKNPLAACYTAHLLGGYYRSVMCGGGPHTEAYLAMARKIDPRVIHQPVVNNVGNIYRALDCMILASRSEGFSLALAEAWYCYCPTVSTPVGATELEELHGKLTTIVPIAHRPLDLVSAVITANSPQNRSNIERAGAIVRRHYTAHAMCRRWEQYLRRIYTQNSP
jgi:glycosyltransferase involved in cell wall biosynthesis